MRRLLCYPISMLILGQVTIHNHSCDAAEFVNLDFESASLPVVPPDRSGGFVSIADALPGWNGYFGAIPHLQVLHNDQALGSATIAVWGPNYFFPRIEGRYNAWLFPGPDISRIPIVSADVSISQVGLVPIGTQSLQFKARICSFPSQAERFVVSLGGSQLSVVPLLNSELYTLYAADISPYAGRELELRFTVFDLPEVNPFTLDSITFSVEPIPEPRLWALWLLGLLLLGRRIAGGMVRAQSHWQ